MNLHEKKGGFLNKALRPSSLRSLAPPTAFGRWRRVGLLGLIYLVNLGVFVISKGQGVHFKNIECNKLMIEI